MGRFGIRARDDNYREPLTVQHRTAVRFTCLQNLAVRCGAARRGAARCVRVCVCLESYGTVRCGIWFMMFKCTVRCRAVRFDKKKLAKSAPHRRRKPHRMNNHAAARSRWATDKAAPLVFCCFFLSPAAFSDMFWHDLGPKHACFGRVAPTICSPFCFLKPLA